MALQSVSMIICSAPSEVSVKRTTKKMSPHTTIEEEELDILPPGCLKFRTKVTILLIDSVNVLMS